MYNYAKQITDIFVLVPQQVFKNNNKVVSGSGNIKTVFLFKRQNGATWRA